jgi:gluconolactonase
VWADVTGAGDGVPDGMKIDSAGNLYCCGPAGVHVFAPDARCLGVIHTPEVVANFTWGEDDMKSLFMTASNSLYRARTKTPGIPLF